MESILMASAWCNRRMYQWYIIIAVQHKTFGNLWIYTKVETCVSTFFCLTHSKSFVEHFQLIWTVVLLCIFKVADLYLFFLVFDKIGLRKNREKCLKICEDWFATVALKRKSRCKIPFLTHHSATKVNLNEEHYIFL